MTAVKHRILIYTTCYNVLDGVTLTIRKIEQELLAVGHSVCILTSKSGDKRNTHLVGENKHRQLFFIDNSLPVPMCTDPKNPDMSYHLGFSLSAKIRDQISDFNPTLIHITVPDCVSLHMIQYAREREIPLMGTYHSNLVEYMAYYGMGFVKPVMQDFIRHQYSFFQALYVPTPYTQKFLEESYELGKATKLGIFSRGIDLERFSPRRRSTKFRRKLKISDDEVIICWVGRVVAEKRPDIFAHVIRRLHARKVRFRAIVVGAGTFEEELTALPNTHFLGWMTGDDLCTAYASSDLFFFPSAVETFGNVTLEAAASGLPLVVEANCSGHLVENDVNGYGCSSVEDFFEATFRLVTDSALRQRMSKASRKLSLQYENKKVMTEIIKDYNQVTEEFHEEYGGNHSNRDAIYLQKKGSFVGGTYPRTLVVQTAEFIFVIIFLGMWHSHATLFSIFNSLRYVYRSATLLFDWKKLHMPGEGARARATTAKSGIGEMKILYLIVTLLTKLCLLQMRLESSIRSAMSQGISVKNIESDSEISSTKQRQDKS